ncbi:MAG: tetratricopeptide repeat protein [Candidatus Methylomirabilales bacterium]
MSRLEALEEMLTKNPGDALLHYMLANEYFNAGRLPECVALLEKYLTMAEDEGAAYRTLAQAFVGLGKIPEARRAYEEGIRAAQKFEHPSMVAEYEEMLRTLE